VSARWFMTNRRDALNWCSSRWRRRATICRFERSAGRSGQRAGTAYSAELCGGEDSHATLGGKCGIFHTRLDRAAGTVSFDVRVKNTTGEVLSGPVRVKLPVDRRPRPGLCSGEWRFGRRLQSILFRPPARWPSRNHGLGDRNYPQSRGTRIGYVEVHCRDRRRPPRCGRSSPRSRVPTAQVGQIFKYTRVSAADSSGRADRFYFGGRSGGRGN